MLLFKELEGKLEAERSRLIKEKDIIQAEFDKVRTELGNKLAKSEFEVTISLYFPLARFLCLKPGLKNIHCDVTRCDVWRSRFRTANRDLPRRRHKSVRCATRMTG